MEKKNNDDKPKIAVALEYTPGEQAPKILATTVYSSGGIISPISSFDKVSASLESAYTGTSASPAFSIRDGGVSKGIYSSMNITEEWNSLY
jgi:hypothetical protein